MAMTQTEARVMELWDACNGVRQIASATGLNTARVHEIVQIYHCRPEHRKHCDAMAISSAALRTAILAQFTRPTIQQGAPL